MTADEWYDYLKQNAGKVGVDIHWADDKLRWFCGVTASDPELEDDTSAAWATLTELQDMEGGEDFGMDVAFVRGGAP